MDRHEALLRFLKVEKGEVKFTKGLEDKDLVTIAIKKHNILVTGSKLWETVILMNKKLIKLGEKKFKC